MDQKKILIEYLKMKIEQEDWHAVSDAANDLRELEVRQGQINYHFTGNVFNPKMEGVIK